MRQCGNAALVINFVLKLETLVPINDRTRGLLPENDVASFGVAAALAVVRDWGGAGVMLPYVATSAKKKIASLSLFEV